MLDFTPPQPATRRAVPGLSRIPTPRLCRLVFASLGMLLISACASSADKAASEQAVTTAAPVDLDRYMGPWYILASIPLSFEKGAHNPVESYVRNPDGSIAAVFQFRRDRFDGELVTHVTNAIVDSERDDNAVWHIRLVWPFRSEYRVGFVEPDYSYAIISRSERDHVWLIGRTPKVSDAAYARYRGMISAMGYDMDKFGKTQQNGEFPTPGLAVSLPGLIRK